jgi:hypothetical protein
LAEGERRGDVDGEGGERGADLDRLPGAGGRLQAGEQPPRAGGDDVEVALQEVAVERCHREPPRPAPVGPLGGEDADRPPHLFGDRADLAPAAEAVGPLAQDLVDDVGAAIRTMRCGPMSKR